MSGSAFIQLHHLTLSYGRFKAVEDVSGTFAEGSLTAIIGPNGGGKSTLVKAINGMISPSSGHITFAPNIQNHMAYMPQKSDIDLTFPITVEEVACMGLLNQTRIVRGVRPQSLQKIHKALDMVGLEGKYHHLLQTLSFGQLQRLFFARLMLQDEPVMIMDEPFASIDLHTKELLIGLIQRWHQQKKTIIVILHELDLVAKYFPSTLLLSQRLVAWGKTTDVLSDHNMSLAFRQLLQMNECDRHHD